jgi:streptomycin 6-kinase
VAHVDVPVSLGWLRQHESGRAWLASLPRLVSECADQWALRLGPPFPESYVSLVLPAELPNGTPAVLKVQYPDRETQHEAAALAAWEGNGAVRLLDDDDARHALLLERCEPATPLSTRPNVEALEVLIDLLPRLWVPAPPQVRSLAEEAAWWAAGLVPRWERSGRPFERELLDVALEALDRLPQTQAEQVLLHQDLHPGNVLAARREPWLVIDPKPLAGERAFAVAPIVRAAELGHSRRLTVRRLDHLSNVLHIDRERARGWALAQTVAWAFEENSILEGHVATARWLREA